MKQYQQYAWRYRRLFFVAAAAFALLWGASALYSAIRPAGPVTLDIPAGLTRTEAAERIGSSLHWSAHEKSEYVSASVQMQWAEFNPVLPDIFAGKFDWREQEREAFLISSTKYFTAQYDFLFPLYVPGSYTFAGNAKPAEVADVMIDRVKLESGDDLSAYVAAHLDPDAMQNVSAFVRSDIELLPDLLPAPPSDLVLEVRPEDGALLLRFSTLYYNKGKGDLELFADPKTAGVRADIERNVYQRIARADGGERNKLAGTFMWHQEHLHYHFADFITYDLEAVEVEGEMPDLSGIKTKSTFCIRDVSLTDLDIPNKPEDAHFMICGKEKQGISVGWADTYYYTYADQALNVSDLPKGKYKLTFHVNPANRFDEMDTANNISSTVFEMDPSKKTLKILEETPQGTPEVEHVYLDSSCDSGACQN